MYYSTRKEAKKYSDLWKVFKQREDVDIQKFDQALIMVSLDLLDTYWTNIVRKHQEKQEEN